MTNYKSKFLTQLIPSTEQNTDFLINILEKVLDSNLINKSEKEQLWYILDSSFNQIQILDQKEYLENIPFTEFFLENCPSLSQPKTNIN